MAFCWGQIVGADGQVVAETEVWIDSAMGPGGRPQWGGSCDLPVDHGVDAQQATYTLRLDDGRSGEITIEHFQPHESGKATIRFRGITWVE